MSKYDEEILNKLFENEEVAALYQDLAKDHNPFSDNIQTFGEPDELIESEPSQNFLNWKNNKERRKLIDSVKDSFKNKYSKTFKVADMTLSTPPMGGNAWPLLCLLYKIYPMGVFAMEALSLYQRAFVNWNAIGMKQFNGNDVLKLVDAGYLLASKSHDIYPELSETTKNANIYYLSPRGKELVERFIYETFNIPVFRDELLAKLFAFNLDNCDEFEQFAELIDAHKTIVASYIYSKKKKFQKALEDKEDMRPESFFFRLEYSFYKNYYKELQLYISKIYKHIKQTYKVHGKLEEAFMAEITDEVKNNDATEKLVNLEESYLDSTQKKVLKSIVRKLESFENKGNLPDEN